MAYSARTLEEGTHSLLARSLQPTHEEIEASGGEATGVVGDVSSHEECKRIVEVTHAAYVPIGVLINNAALSHFVPVSEFPVGQWLRSFAVFFHAPFYLSQLAPTDRLPRGGSHDRKHLQWRRHRSRPRLCLSHQLGVRHSFTGFCFPDGLA